MNGATGVTCTPESVHLDLSGEIFRKSLRILEGGTVQTANPVRTTGSFGVKKMGSRNRC